MASGTHIRKGGRGPARGVVIAAVVVAVVAGVIAAVGAKFANHNHHSQALDAASSPPPTTVPATPLRLTSASPAPGAHDVASDAVITLAFSAPLATTDPHPIITPPTAGSWSTSGSTLTFSPDGGWVPYSTVNVTVPPGLVGSAGSRTTPLTTSESMTFTVAPGSTLRLQQLLAELGYLPVAFTPAGQTAGEAAVDTNPTAEVSSLPVLGTFSWRFPNTPSSLSSQWVQGADNVIDHGAIMAFESAHGLATDGVAGQQVWRSLLAAAAGRQMSKQPYNYLMVSEALPETLQVWSDGQIIASSLANTGISQAPTALGTYPVYARYASTTMSGHNPDGSYYSDPGVLWVAYFNGGDAVHQFPRPGYGYPQSLGCVELPSSTAETIWGMDPIGTLVTVS